MNTPESPTALNEPAEREANTPAVIDPSIGERVDRLVAYVRAKEAISAGTHVAISRDELSRLRAEVEKYRGGIHTHGPDCWSWGWRHYECAEREIARLRARVEELERDAGRYRWLRDRADMKFSGGLNGLKLAHSTLGAKHHGPQWDERIDAARAKEAKRHVEPLP